MIGNMGLSKDLPLLVFVRRSGGTRRDMKKGIPFVILISFMLFLACSREEEDAFDARSFPDMIQYNYEHNIFKNGRKYLIADIKEAHFYDEEKKIECTEFNSVLYNSEGEITTKIKSDKGTINNNEKKVDFIGNVVINMIDKEVTLYTDQLELKYRENTLVSNTDVLIEKKDGSTLSATSMSSDIKTETTTFTDMDVDYFYDDEKEGQE